MIEGLTDELVALRVARELKDGQYVNLGVGIPTQVQKWLPEDIDVIIHSEIGIVGCGGFAEEGEYDNDVINAGGEPITILPGGCFLDAVEAFGIMRGGHLDISILGAFQVSEKGDLASWSAPAPNAVLPGVGGAMDVAHGAKRVIVTMRHVEKSGRPKVLTKCTYPLTARGVVTDIFTDLAVIKVTPEGLVLMETAPGVTAEEVQACTEARLIVSPNLTEMAF